MWKLEQHRLTPKHENLGSFVPLVKKYHINCVDNNSKPFKLTCKNCNRFVRCDEKSE